MDRLWLRLTLAFALVVLVAMGAIGFVLQWRADSEFRQYVARSWFAEEGGLLDSLADHYRTWGSWEGAPALLGGEWPPAWAPGKGHWPQPEARQALVLADSSGRVIYGSGRVRSTANLRARSLPITVDGQTVGYLYAGAPRTDALGPLEQGFLHNLRTSLLIGASVAGGLGLLLGLLLSRNLTAPLSRLAGAARSVAAGDLGQKVEEGGSVEIAEVARSFNEMTTALQQAETLRQNLMADVAHELRTPLTVLQGNLSAILDGVYPLDKTEIARLHEESQLLGRLVEDLRELALAEAGRLSLHVRSADVGPIIKGTEAAFRPAAKEKGLSLVSEVDEGLPAAAADPDRLAQILRNLLSNALYHTPAGGHITMQATSAGDQVEISVIDSGEGIAPEDLPHVFGRFWRGDRSRARETGGSGLGLAIARQLVLSQGGDIGVESQPGRGSRFWFWLPPSTGSRTDPKGFGDL